MSFAWFYTFCSKTSHKPRKIVKATHKIFIIMGLTGEAQFQSFEIEDGKTPECTVWLKYPKNLCNLLFEYQWEWQPKGRKNNSISEKLNWAIKHIISYFKDFKMQLSFKHVSSPVTYSVLDFYQYSQIQFWFQMREIIIYPFLVPVSWHFIL